MSNLIQDLLCAEVQRVKLEQLQRKARMLDRLVDEAADYCALRASNSDFHYDARIAQNLAVEVFGQCSNQRWYEEGNSEYWAEAEARLRNGECWHLFGEGES